MADRSPTYALTFRPARPGDANTIVGLVESAYRGDASRVGWTTEADLLDGQRTDATSIAGLIQSPDDCLLLADCEGAVVSSCHLRREGEAAYFGMFAVVPQLQANGLGRRVLAEAERHARTAFGAKEMRMTVIDCREELIAWYERRGYARTGEHLPFPYGDARYGLPRRDDLRFETLRKRLIEPTS
ncbi:MAG: GNAT family N-acetyltransferase [Lysobacterales bacterium]